ncbi:MAG: PQQ-binding-like beta-propeller repeat protein [Verrucomicrobiaceae bacterium]|nr:PQQ-binding-like beta-propeller repeat protein [Verrucomicrobiaceae bacterium]
MTRKLALYPVATITLLTTSAFAIWPQYRGPKSDGSTSEKLPKVISLAEPSWRIPLNTGFSSFVADDKAAYTVVRREIEGTEHEMLLSIHAETGKELWASKLGLSRYDGGGNSGADGNKGGDGPRSTPAIANGKVFVIDAGLSVYAFNAADGEELWNHNVLREFKGRQIKWKNAASPLLEGDLLYMAGGGEGQSFLAFHQATGELAWGSGDALMTHATPIATTMLGKRQILFFNQNGVTSVDPSKGEQLWHHDFPYRTSSAAAPVVYEDIVYCSAGYGVGSTAFQVKLDGTTEELWRESGNKMANHWSSPVCYEGHLFGLYGFKKYGEAPLACYDIRTGELKWEESGFGPGHLTLVDDRLLVLGDTGQLVVVAADPSGYQEIAKQDVLDGKCWTTPIYSGGKIFARSAKEGICVSPTS